MDLNAYGSRGQQRSAALSLRLAEANYLQLKTQEPPILLLDDVLSELDQNRRTALLEFISPFQQGLITTTELDYFETFFLARSAKFKVSGGAVFRLETGIKPIKENGFNHNITQIKEV
jgi:DNA replication and repair protein RecF